METLYMNSEKTNSWIESCAQKYDAMPACPSSIFAMQTPSILYTKTADFLWQNTAMYLEFGEIWKFFIDDPTFMTEMFRRSTEDSFT